MITHILRNGQKLDDITGHVVKRSDAEAVYALFDSINQQSALRKENLHERADRNSAAGKLADIKR